MGEFDYVLNKQQFWDPMKLRYRWPIPGLPISCQCAEGFDVQHALSCKKGGFVTLRHNEVRDITGTLLSDVCKDVELELSLFILNEEEQTMRNTVLDEVQRYICDRIFWVCGQKAFFDVRVFDPNDQSYSKQILEQCYSLNENEKKRPCNTRVMKVDQGSFTHYFLQQLKE